MTTRAQDSLKDLGNLVLLFKAVAKAEVVALRPGTPCHRLPAEQYRICLSFSLSGPHDTLLARQPSNRTCIFAHVDSPSAYALRKGSACLHAWAPTNGWNGWKLGNATLICLGARGTKRGEEGRRGVMIYEWREDSVCPSSSFLN